MLSPWLIKGMGQPGEQRRRIMVVVMALMGWGFMLMMGGLFGAAFMDDTL